MKDDRRYLDETAASLRDQGLTVTVKLALGDPPAEILRTAHDEQCDLIAMTLTATRLIATCFLAAPFTRSGTSHDAGAAGAGGPMSQ